MVRIGCDHGILANVEAGRLPHSRKGFYGISTQCSSPTANHFAQSTLGDSKPNADRYIVLLVTISIVPASIREFFNLMPNQYSEPVSKLLTFGSFDIHRNNEPWPNYLELGITQEDIPQLIRMMVDDDLNTADPKELRVWAPLHAWGTLGQSRAVSSGASFALSCRHPDTEKIAEPDSTSIDQDWISP